MRGTKKIDWLNHFLEFIVVVIGILLAFQLNTCRESQKEHVLVEEHVASILEETQFNKTQIKGSIENSERLLAQLDTLITLTGEKDLNLPKMHRLSLALMSLDYMYIKKNAYQSFVETGDIRFVQNTKLRDEIVSLYEYYSWVSGMDESSRTSYLNNYLPYATENFDLITYQPQTPEIYTNKLYRNYLSIYRYTIQYRLQKQQDVLAIINDFLENNN